MGDLYLIYVNLLGVDYNGDFNYEFIFSETTENIDGEDWDVYPSSGQPSPPHKHLINKVGTLVTSIELHVIQNSDTFAVWDALDGVTALAWEDVNQYDSYPEVRLVFPFGLPIKDVEDKLYEKDFVLNYKFIKDEVKL